jgi:sec-independent protein translocase protein TatC
VSKDDPNQVYPDLGEQEAGAETTPAAEKPMGFFDHIEELRWVLVKSAAAYLLFAVLIGFFLKEFNDVLLWPFYQVQKNNPTLQIDLYTNSIMEGMTVPMQLCFFGALAPAAPFLFYFVAGFVAPALKENEKRLAMPGVLSAVLLFLLGAAFGFFMLMPTSLQVSVELNKYLGFQMRWTPDSYYTMLLWLVLGVGGSFEFPLLIVLLVYLGILEVSTLRHYRRHAIVAIFLIAAVVTPTPDPLTQTLFAAPLWILYEIAILVGARIEKKRAVRLKAA